MFQVTTIPANTRVEFYDPGDFFRLMQDGGAGMTVEYYSQGKKIAEAIGVRSGYAEYFRGVAFDRIAITNNNASAQNITFVVRLGNEVRYDSPPTGQVSIANGAFSQYVANVGTSSFTLKPANTARGYFLVQNRDTLGNLYVSVDGSAATVAKGILLAPGESWELMGRCPNGAINAIGDIASNPNVIVVEG